MQVLGWFSCCQMERQKWSYFNRWCISQDFPASSHSVRSWTGTSKSNRWITMVSTSAIAMATCLPLHLRSMGSLFWIEFWIRNRPDSPTSTAAARWHPTRLGMHLCIMQKSGCFGTAAWHTLFSRICRSWQRLFPTLRESPGSAMAKVASSASSFGIPSLPRPPAPRCNCSYYTGTYAVHWKQP